MAHQLHSGQTEPLAPHTIGCEGSLSSLLPAQWRAQDPVDPPVPHGRSLCLSSSVRSTSGNIGSRVATAKLLPHTDPPLDRWNQRRSPRDPRPALLASGHQRRPTGSRGGSVVHRHRGAAGGVDDGTTHQAAQRLAIPRAPSRRTPHYPAQRQSGYQQPNTTDDNHGDHEASPRWTGCEPPGLVGGQRPVPLAVALCIHGCCAIPGNPRDRALGRGSGNDRESKGGPVQSCYPSLASPRP